MIFVIGWKNPIGIWITFLETHLDSPSWTSWVVSPCTSSNLYGMFGNKVDSIEWGKSRGFFYDPCLVTMKMRKGNSWISLWMEIRVLPAYPQGPGNPTNNRKGFSTGVRADFPGGWRILRNSLLKRFLLLPNEPWTLSIQWPSKLSQFFWILKFEWC